MDSTTPIYVAAFIAIILAVFKGLKQVPQSKVVLVERFGKYHRTLNAGINFVVPFLDSTPHEPIDVAERQIKIDNQNVITADNVRLKIDIAAFYRITDAANFKYRIRDGKNAVESTIDATVRALVGRRSLDQFNADRLSIANEVAIEVRSTAAEWGVAMGRVEIVDVVVADKTTQEALGTQAQKERERRGSLIEAEAIAAAIRLRAEAEAFESRLQADVLLYREQKAAEGRRIKAESDAWALTTIGSALEKDGAKFAQQSEILRAQVDAMQALGTAESSKLVVLPADLIQTAQSLTSLLNRKS